MATVGQKVDGETSIVTIDGLPLPLATTSAYYLLYKPLGVISTVSDPQGRPTAVDLVPDVPPVHLVGRLDADSEGLILLTNDGELTNLVTHPRYGITKTYVVTVAGSPARRTLRRLELGVELDDGPARAISVTPRSTSRTEALLEIVMGEGRNRVVRRMLASVGHDVQRLVRVGIGPVRDPDLRSGDWRTLTIAEVRALYSSAAEPWEDGGPAELR